MKMLMSNIFEFPEKKEELKLWLKEIMQNLKV